MFKLQTDKQILTAVLGALTFIAVFISVLFTVNTSLSCLDRYGCLRRWCDFEYFDKSYMRLIRENDTACPYQASQNLNEIFTFDDLVDN